MGLPQRASVEKTVHEMEIYWIPGAVVTKESHVTVFWYMKEPITIDLLENGVTLNCASYCQLLKQISRNLLNDCGIYPTSAP